jgi:hypothetical protein
MTLKWFDNTAELMALAGETPGTNVFPLYSGPFPLVHDTLNPDNTPGPRQDVELVNARIYQVKVGDDEYAAVALCRMVDELAADGVTVTGSKPEWTMYCGDKQVSGEYTGDGKTLAARLRKEGKVNMSVANAVEASEWVGKIKTLSNCGFFRILKRGLEQTPPVVKFCGHTKAALANTPVADLDGMVDELKDWLAGAAGSVSAVSGPLSPEEEQFHDAAFIQHVLLAGERGAGKSYLARQAADKYEAVYLEMQMHPSMEAWEFRAHDRSWNGKVYTVMGKLAEAVYWIQQGKRVVLCMDEFLNMNPIYTTAINTPLTLTANDTYLIETGKINDLGGGIGQLETVEVPADMLWVVATSNIGARYGLDKIAPSVRARFQIILMNTNPARTKTILEKNLANYEMPMDLAEMFKKFTEAANQAVAQSELDEEATTRLACNVIRACHLRKKRDKKKCETLKQWLPEIKKQMLYEIAQVVNFELGPLDSDQEERYKALVETSFRVR